ncbi:ABC-type Na+ efflux pump, permease component [Paucilactobacillus oligofermentans DSM 15707 = LMG 22743]|uniref:ABC-type Na+ efflux pump, permease component n=2 Tax=Paucilactobacillus oligofermentans TaxID=293371 RepID=A0A0R1RFS4_9LACO|nr:ABC-type Na+ efflux pump, permease component [Paucilactobacillus oligofermentans DSM 15707 = LMG 22743]
MKQVFMKNVRSTAWIILVISPIVLLGIMVGIGHLVENSNNDPTIGVVSSSPTITKTLAKSLPATKVKNFKSQTLADKALNHKKLDAVLVVPVQNGQINAKLKIRDGGKTVSTKVIQSVLTQLQVSAQASKLNLNADQVQTLLKPAGLSTKTVAVNDGKSAIKNDKTNTSNRLIALSITVLMLVFTMSYGSMIAQEIATEKGSRIMETLLSSVDATTQFFGKLAGILLLLLVHVLLYAVIILVGWHPIMNLELVKSLVQNFDFSVLTSINGLIFIIFFIIAVLTYSVLAALTGSLVANQEQVQQAVMPISMLGLLGYIFALVAQGGDSLVVKIASYVPFVGPSVMPVRLAMSFATIGDAIISILISVIFLGLFTWFTAKAYKSNVLVYNQSGFWKSIRSTISIMRAERKKL